MNYIVLSVLVLGLASSSLAFRPFGGHNSHHRHPKPPHHEDSHEIFEHENGTNSFNLTDIIGQLNASQAILNNVAQIFLANGLGQLVINGTNNTLTINTTALVEDAQLLKQAIEVLIKYGFIAPNGPAFQIIENWLNNNGTNGSAIFFIPPPPPPQPSRIPFFNIPLPNFFPNFFNRRP